MTETHDNVPKSQPHLSPGAVAYPRSVGAHSAIFQLDENEIVRGWNIEAQLLTGYSAGEVFGRRFANVLFFDRHDGSLKDTILEPLEKRRTQIEDGWCVKKDGSLTFVKVSISPILDEAERLSGFTVAIEDGYRYDSDSDFRENEEQFLLFMAAVQDYSIIMLDVFGNVIRWNHGAHRIKGYTQNDILGKHFSIFYTPEDIALGKPELELRLAREDGRFEEEGWRVRKDGSRFFANVVVAPLFRDNGELYGFAKITRDITERLANDTKTKEFYSILSHELRSPMTSILGTFGLLEGGLAGELSGLASEIIYNSRFSCERLLRMIDELLDLSQLTSGHNVLDKREVSSTELVSEAVNGLGTIGGSFSANIEVVIDNALPKLYVDRDRIVQVLTNLISNALKFSPKGSPVQILVSRRDDFLKFEIIDRGPGIPPDARERLFGKFQRIGKAKNDHSGTGLGLAISKSIVEQHAGRVDYESELGKGAKFWFELPVGISDCSAKALADS